MGPWFFNEGLPNNHSGVHQWYRWSIAPNDLHSINVKYCTNGEWTNKPIHFDDSLNPCNKGWKGAILNSSSAQGRSLTKLSNVLAANTLDETQVQIDINDGTFVSNNGLCTLSTDISSQMKKIKCDESNASFAEVDVNIPNLSSYISFDYKYNQLSEDDYFTVFVDSNPIAVLKKVGSLNNQYFSSGLIPVSGKSVPQKFIVAFFGSNSADAQIEITNLMALTKPDTDEDGVADEEDNCPDDPNPNQEDTDNDLVGNVCDAFPTNPNETVDTDGDGIGNNADTDDDNDGVLDLNDAFPLDPTESVDTDGDGIGNNTDTDDDNDGVIDSEDNCPLVKNSNQKDSDNNGKGDACDDDFPWIIFYPAIMGGNSKVLLNEGGLALGSGWVFYNIDVASKYNELKVTLSNMDNDFDLYVRKSLRPTFENYDCRPYIGGIDTEECILTNSSDVKWFIGVHDFSNLGGRFEIKARATK